MKKSLCSQSGFYRRVFVAVEAQMHPLAFRPNPRPPRVPPLAKVHARDPRLIPFVDLVVLAVLLNRANAKILVSIIKSISVDVVPSHAFWSVEDCGVHRKKFEPPCGPCDVCRSIEGLRSIGPHRKPIGFGKFLVSMCRYLCNLPLREWDNAVGLIQRLNNRLAANATFGHDSTSNGIAVFNRFSIVSGSPA